MLPVQEIHPLPIEEQLLLCCARTELTRDEIARIKRLVHRAVDWELLIQLAHRNGIEPLLFLSLSNSSPADVPKKILKRLEDFYLQNAGHNLFLSRQLIEVFTLFESHGIQTIPYKGPLMTNAIYGNLAYRQFGDLDFLLEKRDVPKVNKLLIDLGYKPVISELNSSIEKNFLRFQSSFDFFRGNVLLEMHWEIVPRCFFARIEVSSFWDRLISVNLNGKAIRTVSPEDLLLILCVDASRELWERLGRVCDIAQLLRASKSLNWNQIFSEADRIGCKRIVLIGCCMANQMFQAPLPSEVADQIDADRKVGSLSTLMAVRLLERREQSTPFLEDARFQPMYVRMRERLRDKVGYTASLFFTPHVSDWRTIPLPGFLFFLYYAIRPFRLGAKFGARIFRRYFVKRERLKT